MSDKVYEFNSSNAVGQLREIAITKWLENREDVLSVEDVSGDKFYQNLDIDLIVNKTNGTSYTVEIKQILMLLAIYFSKLSAMNSVKLNGVL